MTSRLMWLFALPLVGLALFAGSASALAPAVAQDEPPRPPITVNEFLPTERSLSECLSVLPKPGCGSEARGGWAQTTVFLALLGGLGVIMTRIVIGVRRRTPAPAAGEGSTTPATPPGD